jgi:hypothetical protein
MKSIQLLKKLRGMSAQELEREAAELRKKVWAQGSSRPPGSSRTTTRSGRPSGIWRGC